MDEIRVCPSYVFVVLHTSWHILDNNCHPKFTCVWMDNDPSNDQERVHGSRVLRIENGADVNAEEYHGRTVMHCAVRDRRGH